MKAGLAEIGNLVVFVSCGREGIHQRGEETYAAIFVYLVDPMGLEHLVEGGTLFVRQVVG